MVKEATPSPTHVPDWTIFDEAFSTQYSPLATWEFVDRVRTSGGVLTRRPRRNVWASDERIRAAATSAPKTSVKSDL